jgi:hypothetical protein
MRIVRSLLAFLFFLTGAAVVAGSLALYLAATGRNLPLLRTVVGALGRSFAGQQTTALSLAVRLQPDTQRLSGTARLTVRALAAGRQRLYFLLNDGLSASAAWEETAPGQRTPLRVLRIGLLAVIELNRTLGADEDVRIGIDYAGEPHALASGISGLVLTADDVVITPSDFWYPADLQGFFSADVEVLLPADLTLVHNGPDTSRIIEGTSARVRFSTERAVPALSLVAGRYEEHSDERNGVRGRVFLPPGTHLDPKRLLESLTSSQQIFTNHYGPSGFSQVALYVGRRLRRAFNDGTGLVGIAPRYVADGEYGFDTVAHEVAHNWWGATVMEQWLQPGTGGEWIVEGFAQFSGWRAEREQRGEAALLKTQARDFFDPDHTEPLVAMSALDNGLDAATHPTIYSKGAYVAFMLQQQLGEEAFDNAARQFLDQFRYRSATAADVQTVFAAASQQDLAPFFAAWVNGNESIDLALDPQEGGAAVRNHRTAPAPAQLGLWSFARAAAPDKQTTSVGATVSLAGAERLVVDPLASVADMFRSNNVLPRHDNPRSVASSTRGDLMIVTGEPYAWEPATIDVPARGGSSAARAWVIDRGLMAPPAWSADGTRVLAVESARGGKPTLLSLNVTDGSRRSVGHDVIATATADATIVARDSRLVSIAGGGATLLAEHPQGHIAFPSRAAGWRHRLRRLVGYADDGSARAARRRRREPHPVHLARRACALALVARRHQAVRRAAGRLGCAALGALDRRNGAARARARSGGDQRRCRRRRRQPRRHRRPGRGRRAARAHRDFPHRSEQRRRPPLRSRRMDGLQRRVVERPVARCRRRRSDVPIAADAQGTAYPAAQRWFAVVVPVEDLHGFHGPVESVSRFFRLRAFAFAGDAVGGRWRQVQHFLGEHVDDEVDDVAHGDDPRRAVRRVHQRDVPKSADAHHVERVGDAVFQRQALRIGSHDLGHGHRVDVGLLAGDLGQHVALGEDPDQAVVLGDEHAAGAMLVHCLDRVAHAHDRLDAHRWP